MRDTAGEPADGFHFLRVPEFLFALAQRFLGRAPLLHFADEIIALLEELQGRSRELSELGVISRYSLDWFRIVSLEALHDLAKWLADPEYQRRVNEKQDHESKKEKREDKRFVCAV
jgi:hypothetical protein